MQVLGVLILVLSQVLMPESWVFSAIGFIFALSSLGGISGNTNACFMAHFSKNAGTASAVMGASQSIASAVIAGSSAVFLSDNLLLLSLVMLALSFIAFFVSKTAKLNHVTRH